MKNLDTEFKTLSYIIKNSKKILLFAHTNPDGDTSGSVLAMKEYITSLNKTADIACFDPIPSFLEMLTEQKFEFPEHLDFKSYDIIIGCDSVERGFQSVLSSINENTVTVIIDHHPDINLTADVVIIDSKSSSVCEIIYEYFISQNIIISKNIATFLMVGILSDTGNFQHSNTTSRVMEISADLLKKGASVPKIIKATFANKKLSTLKLWGRAFEKAKINPANGLITTVLTKEDIESCNATTEDIGQVASILNTVPGTKLSLVLSEREDGIIKGSLRSEEYKGINVSEIAHLFGGGGHKLASGFEIKGKIVETENGWEIV
ncbi:MAG TPA: bifunctional oligoribonuclease/PAP phosphatase NrnA [Candidatus Moranbacteria bacterium]|nr:bifunctional oligoribonuclease/PAP phosphatase NrnA [Candidatus Moranbacteria bacterium]HRZ33538.1 bifunctional oligoribonuclease/PAP phosphatase NrnA [Candidatus Moranbacteria bacterium]